MYNRTNSGSTLSSVTNPKPGFQNRDYRSGVTFVRLLCIIDYVAVLRTKEVYSYETSPSPYLGRTIISIRVLDRNFNFNSVVKLFRRR